MYKVGILRKDKLTKSILAMMLMLLLFNTMNVGFNPLAVTASENNDGVQSTSGLACGNSLLENGSFEEGGVDDQYYHDASEIPGWETTDGENVIEIWNTSTSQPSQAANLIADHGIRFAELNATEPGMLYQDVETVPGEEIDWSLSHMGRLGEDTMALMIGPVDGELEQIDTMTDGNTAWGHYRGTYVVPEGQTTTRFGFKAISSHGDDLGRGNFLDNIFFGTEPCIVTEKESSVDGDVEADEEFTYTINIKNNNDEAIENVNFEDVIPEGTEYVLGTLAFDGEQLNDSHVQNGKITYTIDSLAPTTEGKKLTFNVKALETHVGEEAVNEANVTYVNTKSGLNEYIKTNKVENTIILKQLPLEPATTSVDVEKVWKGEAEDAVTINLLADGEEVDTVELSEANDWAHTFADLPTVHDVTDPEEIVYTVNEVEVDGYQTEIEGSAKEGFVITNTEVIDQLPLEPSKTSVDVEKVWKGEAEDAVTINLLADGEEVDTVELSEANDWAHTFTDLPTILDVTDPEKIEYTVEEVEIAGYNSEITGDAEEGFTVTNTRTGETAVSVDKEWELYEKEAEAIEVDLLQNGEQIDTVTLDGVADWTHTFNSLPAFDEEGIMYTYTVEEVEIDGFEVEVTGDQDNGYTITNTEIVELKPLEPSTTSVDVEKVWKGEAQDAVTIHLLADGEKVDTIELSDANDWAHTFTDLPTILDVTNPELIVYTVEEEAIEDYEVSIDGNAKDGFTVTNTRTGETTVSVDKEWELYEKEAEAIEVDLLQNGEQIDTVTLDENVDWTHTFDNIPAFDEEGIMYTYTVEEVEIDGFDVEVTGDQNNGYTITNTEIVELKPLEPSTTSVDVEKVWKGEAQDAVTIHLLADGEKVDTIELSDDNDWAHTFTDLPTVMDVTNPELIVYTVEEEAIEGYDVSIDGNAEEGFVVTNTEVIDQIPLEPSTTSVDVEKVWKGEAQDAVTIHLLADGEKVDTVELSDDNDWAHTFTDLPTLMNVTNPELIVYTVEEEAIEGYDVSIDGNAEEGFVVTNTFIEEEPKEEPSDPADKDDSGSKPTVEPDDSKDDSGDKLPKTATNTFNLLMIGLVVMLLGTLAFFFRRKESQQ